MTINEVRAPIPAFSVRGFENAYERQEESTSVTGIQDLSLVARLHRRSRNAPCPSRAALSTRIEEPRGSRSAVGEVELPATSRQSRAPLCASANCKVTPAGPTHSMAPIRRRPRDAPRTRERPRVRSSTKNNYNFRQLLWFLVDPVGDTEGKERTRGDSCASASKC